MRQTSLVAIVMTLLLPSLALAWGGDGHQLVCMIAEDHLSTVAKANVHDLLGSLIAQARFKIGLHLQCDRHVVSDIVDGYTRLHEHLQHPCSDCEELYNLPPLQ
jgi:hypothetical protein